MAEAAKLDGAEVIIGNAVDDKILRSAELENAAKLIVAIPEGFDAGQIVQKARAAHPDLIIVARAHSEAEVAHLEKLGAHNIVMGEREIEAKMLTYLQAGCQITPPTQIGEPTVSNSEERSVGK